MDTKRKRIKQVEINLLEEKPVWPDNLKPLYDLAYNLWAYWTYEAVALFYRIDTPLFRNVNHNPLKMLHSLVPALGGLVSIDDGL